MGKVLFGTNNRKTRVHTEKLYYIGKNTGKVFLKYSKRLFHRNIFVRKNFCQLFFTLLKEEPYNIRTYFYPYYSFMVFN